MDPALLEKARRLGPRPYSEGGPSPAPALPSTAALVGWMVDAIDGWWAEMGCPDPFTLVEIGAAMGPGPRRSWPPGRLA